VFHFGQFIVEPGDALLKRIDLLTIVGHHLTQDRIATFLITVRCRRASGQPYRQRR
jgi:hypothetical protein